MIRYLFKSDIIDEFSRPNTPNILFSTFIAKGKDIFGKGSQLVTNAGSSMLTNSSGTIPEIKNFIHKYFNVNNIAVLYLRERIMYPSIDILTDEFIEKTSMDKFVSIESINIRKDQILILMRKYLTKYKIDFKFRMYANKIIFKDISTLNFNDNIPIAFLFIVFCLLNIKNNNFLNKSNKKETEYKEAAKYYSSEEEFIKKISEVLQSPNELKDLTECCVGQYRFIDFQLSAVGDEMKALPQVLIHLLIDEESVTVEYCKRKVIKLNESKTRSKKNKEQK